MIALAMVTVFWKYTLIGVAYWVVKDIYTLIITLKKEAVERKDETSYLKIMNKDY